MILNFLVGETNIGNISYLIQYMQNIILRCNQCKITNDILYAFFFILRFQVLSSCIWLMLTYWMTQLYIPFCNLKKILNLF